jgi:hypothetical protein
MRHAIPWLLAALIAPSILHAQDEERKMFTGSRGMIGERPNPEDFFRPLDDSDPEMRYYLENVATGGGCPTMPYERCPEALKVYEEAGDRLAAYLIHHVEASAAEGYPPLTRPLNQIAYTRSETGFIFLRDLVRSRETLSPAYARTAIHALGKTRDERVLDEMLRIIEADPPESFQRNAAVRSLLWVVEETGTTRADVLASLRSLRQEDRVGGYVTKHMERIGIE